MSPDMTGFLNDVKRAAVEAVDAGKPFALVFGKVMSVSPLTVEVDQKMKLTEAQLILTNAVRDFTVNMTVDHATEVVSHGHPVVDTYTGGGSATEVNHSHPYVGTKSFRVHLALKAGEQVLLLRANGGQKFIILDRVEAPS